MTLMMTIILMVRPAKGREDGGIGPQGVGATFLFAQIRHVGHVQELAEVDGAAAVLVQLFEDLP